MWPQCLQGTSGTDTAASSPNIFDEAIDRYGFDYHVFDEDNGDAVDVDVNDNDDETSIEIDDEENAENVPTVAQTPNRQ